MPDPNAPLRAQAPDDIEVIDSEDGSPHRRKGRSARIVLLAAAGVPAGATILAFAGDAGWMFDLLAHFRAQYALVLGVLVPLLLFARSWRGAAFCAVPLAINLGLILPLYIPIDSRSASTSAPTDEGRPDSETDPAQRSSLRVVQFNLQGVRDKMMDVSIYLATLNADVLVLQEVRSSELEDLEFQLGGWRLRHALRREDPFGMAVFVRFTLEEDLRFIEAQTLDMSPAGSSIAASWLRLRYRGAELSILAVHVMPPISPYAAALRNGQLELVAQWAQQRTEPALIVGDLNATPWSVHFRRLIERSGLLNSQHGFGIQGSWPAGGGPLGQIPIDHLLHSAELVTLDRRLGPSLGSDHQPLIVDLAWR